MSLTKNVLASLAVALFLTAGGASAALADSSPNGTTSASPHWAYDPYDPMKTVAGGPDADVDRDDDGDGHCHSCIDYGF